MASRYRSDVSVKLVRIQLSTNSPVANYDRNVTVGMPRDSETNTTYLRVAVNQRSIFNEELDHFRWLDDASTDGIAVISTPSTKIISLYDATNATTSQFFKDMETFLRQEPAEQSPHSDTQGQRELAMQSLVSCIEQGSSIGAETAAKYLARSRANIEFNLSSPNDNADPKSSITPSAAMSSNVLQLTLRIECHLDREPLVGTIHVRSGTELRVLKEEIQAQTNIDRRNQYWYAFDRFMIADDYVFGSAAPVVPLRPKNAPRNKAETPTEPIRSGDTLIMYIAQIQPYT
ncbi:unnamed protein product [Rotaria magnacalcarata]|uniref:Uncharacterized protein n=1 Tax=Rotaria magnacalcarata TaxID=392030 RepID=A0A819LCX1_9BILA|nr:unnamed protein product [Rotaria magnacalcarata]CAF3960139.1 unnamed protein product [Rotaria magnacalcarata]